MEAHGAGSPPVILLGGLAAGLGTLRAFGRRGTRVFVLPGGDHIVSGSRFYRGLPGATQAVTQPTLEGLEAALGNCGFEQAVLSPCSDYWAAIVAERAATRPADGFKSAVARPEVLELFQDKASFADLLVRLGVPHPSTTLIDSAGDLDKVPESVFSSAFLKPRDSQAFSEKFNRKAWWIPSRSEASRMVQAAAEAGFGMVVQEYIPGDADRHVFVDGYCSTGGRIETVFARRRLRMFPADFGNSTALVSIGPGEVTPAIESLKKLFAETAYRGIFSAEFKQDRRDGTFRILEVNTRPWLFVDFAVRCGVDVCYLAYLDALDEPLPRIDRYRIGARCIAPVKDGYGLWALHAGPIRWLSWLAASVTQYQPIWAFDDPAPGLAAMAQIGRQGWEALLR